jgi:hypothetical protein
MLQVGRKLRYIAPQQVLKPLKMLLKVHLDVWMLDHITPTALEAIRLSKNKCTSHRIASVPDARLCVVFVNTCMQEAIQALCMLYCCLPRGFALYSAS